MDWLSYQIDLQVTWQEALLRLGLALVLGILIGWEREAHNKPAGLKTMSLVALGSAAFTLITFEIYQAVLRVNPQSNSDPIRLVEGIIGGIGFLGAGAIIQGRGSVHGVTTAAGIWITGAIGIACGGGHYFLAVLTWLLTLLVLLPLKFFEKKLLRGKNQHDARGQTPDSIED